MANKDYYGGGQQYYPPQGWSSLGENDGFYSLTQPQVHLQDRGVTTPGLSSPNNRMEVNLTVNHTADQGTNHNHHRRQYTCECLSCFTPRSFGHEAENFYSQRPNQSSGGGGASCLACLAGACLCCCAEGERIPILGETRGVLTIYPNRGALRLPAVGFERCIGESPCAGTVQCQLLKFTSYLPVAFLVATLYTSPSSFSCFLVTNHLFLIRWTMIRCLMTLFTA